MFTGLVAAGLMRGTQGCVCVCFADLAVGHVDCSLSHSLCLLLPSVCLPVCCCVCRHTGRFLLAWISCLPFVIWQELGWLSVPVSMVVSFLLFGIEVSVCVLCVCVHRQEQQSCTTLQRWQQEAAFF